MKILCVSDDKDQLVYSSQTKEFFPDVDIVIGAGDLSLKYYEFIISSLNKPLYFVFGNHNLEHYDYYYNDKDVKRFNGSYDIIHGTVPYGGTMIEGKVVRDKKTGLIIAGLGGSNRYNNGKNQFTNRQMNHRMLKMAPRLFYNRFRYGRCLDILVTHAPPLGFNDEIDPCHKGFSAFLTFMDIFKPKYLLHGHVHLIDSNGRRKVVYKRTKIINVYKSFILEDEKLGKKQKKKT